MTADGSDRSFGAPRFDVVLRGYDRRQVDEHLSRLQRLMSRMRNDLDAARGKQVPPPGAATPAGGRARPAPRPRPDGSPPTGANDVVGTFTDRMHAILQSAEDEAKEIRNKARAAARAEEERAAALRTAARAEQETARQTLADLVRQRDAVLAELTRVRGQLEGLLSGPTTRIMLPTQETGPDRREAGAGQPLPGTPEPSEPVPGDEPSAGAAGSPSAPVPGAGGSPAPRTATGTVVLPLPGGAGPPGEADATVAGRTTAVSPAEETALMDPLTGVDEVAEARADPVESTQAVEPAARSSGNGDRSAADRPDDEPGPAAAAGQDDAPTQVAPGSAVRSG